ncbi:MAG: DNA alkylation repair protein [Patescibacteria group bacterium]
MSITKKVINDLMQYSSTDKRKGFHPFFKTGKGEYGEGDKFVGISVPEVRSVAKKYFKSSSLADTELLMKNKIHEVRLCALMIMVYQYETYEKSHDDSAQKQIFDLYLSNKEYINNWDLVDLSCYKIVGERLLKTKDWEFLIKLANSKSLWERRIAMISTFAFIKAKNIKPTIAIAEILLMDKHDLIQKAVGWMLRELGKRVGKSSNRIS